VKIRAANRNLFLGFVFVIGAIVAWMLAARAYREQIGAVKSGNRVFKVTLEQVNQRRTLFPDEPLPEWLVVRGGPRRRWLRFARVAAWVALGIAIGAVAGWEARDVRPGVSARGDTGETMARRAAVAHAVYSPEVRHPVEVGADQEAHLVAWLSKRLGTQVRVPKLDAVGYSLVGGRLLPGENGPVAHFMYQSNQGSRITLYVRTNAATNRETAFRYAREGNVSVFYWVDGKVGYALSSADISKETLLSVAELTYQQLNP